MCNELYNSQERMFTMEFICKKNIFSWTLEKNVQAKKVVDKSLYTYGETVIPIEIREFFEIQDYNKGDIVDIKLVFKEKEFSSIIFYENNFNRSRLKFSTELKRNVKASIDESVCGGDYINNKIIIFFIKENSKKYYMELNVKI